MNEQIILTQYDDGIELLVYFIDSSKNPINISDKDIEITFVSPNNEPIIKYGSIMNGDNGIASFVLSDELTSYSGLWTSYWSIVDDEQNITTQETLTYFVLPKYGGAI
ncbi:MAG: BppU family phage baseplate upper protein [Clostridium sp.]